MLRPLAPEDSPMLSRTLVVGGFTPLTTIDFPGRLAAVVFCQGCPWRCRYCQNAHLLPRSAQDPLNWGSLLVFLRRRASLLDGVVFSGGEPTLQSALPAAIRGVKSLGYQVGLHTAGPYPRRLQAVLSLVDWVGFDIKTCPDDYSALTGVHSSGRRVMESARLLLRSGVDHEFRTTVHPDLLNGGRLRALARKLAAMGVKKYALQECVSAHCLDATLRLTQPGASLEPALERDLGALFPDFSIRRAGPEV